MQDSRCLLLMVMVEPPPSLREQLALCSSLGSRFSAIVLVTVLASSCAHSASGFASRRVLSPSTTLLCDIVFLLGDAPSERYHFLRPSFGVVPHGQWAHLDKLRLALIGLSANLVEPFLCPDSPPSLSSTDSTRGSGCDGSSLLAL